ncbi:XRE family transcriptional regulator [Sedimentibacter sp.]|uniref:helix-turn-helix domain-containing protein n=1 Tax=Sedimentibacter sp. TaxID=1960295 RepID=UPI000EE0D8AD|nr:XRE family transcriptional regulator [Sedimentibacter sp.]HCX62561.1 DNA-binding protein [Clostridiales bacterium]
MDNLLINIGSTLKKTRTEKGLTLEAASNLTGVSKAMLGQIERTESTPTVSTLWKIATGLKIPFSELLNDKSDEDSALFIDNVDPVYESEGKMILYNVFPFNPLSGFEYFYIKMLPGANHTSSPHKASTEEYVVVTKGTLEMIIKKKKYVLKAPSAIFFKADEFHSYSNPYDEEAIFQNVVRY